jgi:hypothetical protein
MTRDLFLTIMIKIAGKLTCAQRTKKMDKKERFLLGRVCFGR